MKNATEEVKKPIKFLRNFVRNLFSGSQNFQI